MSAADSFDGSEPLAEALTGESQRDYERRIFFQLLLHEDDLTGEQRSDIFEALADLEVPPMNSKTWTG